MSFFDDDPFEDIVREFFGGSSLNKSRQNNFIKGEDEDRNIDFVEDEDYIYIIFELPGYEEKDVTVSIKGNQLQIKAQKINQEKIQSYLIKKLNQGMSISKTLPSFVNPKNFKHTMENGILEITFLKKGVKK